MRSGKTAVMSPQVWYYTYFPLLLAQFEQSGEPRLEESPPRCRRDHQSPLGGKIVAEVQDMQPVATRIQKPLAVLVNVVKHSVENRLED